MGLLSHLKTWLQSLPHDAALWELLEHYLCNGWQEVEVALFEGMVLQHPWLDIYYADIQWAVKNAVETLLQGDLYYFYKIDIETHKNLEIL